MNSRIRTGLVHTAMVVGLTGLAYILRGLIVLFWDSIVPGATPSDPNLSIAGLVFFALFPIFGIILANSAAGGIELWREKISFLKAAAAFASGIVLIGPINVAFHTYVIDLFIAQIPVHQYPPGRVFLLLYALVVVLVFPVFEELSMRGLLFRALESLPRRHICFWSVLGFCLIHDLEYGAFKIIATLPGAILLCVIRQFSGSWKYSAAAHAGVNLVAVTWFIPFGQ